MFGNMFSGMFGKGNSPDMQNIPDALGQASMGAPQAFGQGMPSGGFDRNKLAMMLMRGMGGMGRGMGPQMTPQLRDVYQNMTAPQQTVMFNPMGR